MSEPWGHTERTLSQVASYVAGMACQVQFWPSALHPVSVVASDCVVALHPQKARLGDLLLGASLLRRRDRIESLGRRIRREDAERLQAMARRDLLSRLPGVTQLVGDFSSYRAFLSWDQLKVRPIQASDFESDRRCSRRARSR